MNNTKCVHDHLISTFPNNQLLCPNNKELNDNLIHLEKNSKKLKITILSNQEIFI